MSNTIIYLSHRFDLPFFLSLAQQSPALRDNGKINLLVDPSQSLGLAEGDIEKLRSHFHAESVMVLPSHEYRGPSHQRLRRNYLRMVVAKKAINRWNAERATFIVNNKASSVGHLICSIAERVILIQQQGDVRVPGVYRLSLAKTLRANIWGPRVGGRVKRVFVSKTDADLQHHETTYPNARICYCTADTRVANRVYVGAPYGLFEPKGPVAWFGSRCMEWTYFGDRHARELELVIKELAERNAGKHLHYKPRREDEAGEIGLLRKHWRGPISSLDWRPAAESSIDEGHWSASYSIGSTASLYTRAAGIPTQVLYRSLGFPDHVQAHYDTIFTSLPRSFFYAAAQTWPPTDQEFVPSYTDWIDSALRELRVEDT